MVHQSTFPFFDFSDATETFAQGSSEERGAVFTRAEVVGFILGNAHDFWASYENKNFIHLTPRPWLGYLFVGRYAEGDETKCVEINQPHIPTDPAFESLHRDGRLSRTRFKGISYAERYRVFLERMIAKKLYDGACFLVTHEDIAQLIPNYRVLYPELSGEKFLDSLRRHIRGYYFD